MPKKQLMTNKTATKPKGQGLLQQDTYEAFNAIDGRHPWQQQVPDGYVQYSVRNLQHGKVLYFNYDLARDMGLLPPNHKNKLTPELEQKILDTFCIQIVNEFDLQNIRSIKNIPLKPHPHMATRYLQLQHSSKKGKTSGDGRSIWNGIVKHNGIIWDISSRGTGVTCLAPGAVEAQRPLKTGAGEFGYGCGLADVSELYGSLVMSEIFHNNHVHTERMLAIIDLGRGVGIGVRAAPNLIRPAHLFLYLKQQRHAELKRATDYFIQRQTQNKTWRIGSKNPQRFKLMLSEIASSFAKFAAMLERNYIFAWMDWDGDNVLANAGIIDYGSIRQFGLRHDQYRYDDVSRFSTNLNEQRGKARMTVQLFAQLTNYIETGKRLSIGAFANHESVKSFDREFDHELRRLLLLQVGFDPVTAKRLINDSAMLVEKFYLSFMTLERLKTKKAAKKVPDGVNRPPVFNMRKFLREYPKLLKTSISGPKSGKETATLQLIDAESIRRLITSSFAHKSDLKLSDSLIKKINALQSSAIALLRKACSPERSIGKFLEDLSYQAHAANPSARITGNASEFIVEAVMKKLKKGTSGHDVQLALELFIATQSPRNLTDSLLYQNFPNNSPLLSLDSAAGELFKEILKIAKDFEEDI
jgi:hypothetical protein